MKLRIRILIGLVLLTGVMVSAWRASHPLPYWRYQSLTVPNATSADLEQSMRSFPRRRSRRVHVVRPHQLALLHSAQPTYGGESSTPENSADTPHQRGLGPVTGTEDDCGATVTATRGLPSWRVHHFLRNWFPGLRFDAIEGPEWPFTKRFRPDGPSQRSAVRTPNSRR
jgi:hypothetical protein